LRFYVEQLGFGLLVDFRFEGAGRWIGLAPPDGTAILALVAPEPGSGYESLIGRPTQVVFVTEDVRTKYEEWHRRGVHFLHPPHTPAWGGTFTTFEDPDGNSFGLAARDEVSQEIEAQRRAAAEKLESERRVAQEMKIAKQVQARLFPQRLPPLRTLDYAGVCIQARQVGGDYYDFLDLAGGRLGLVVGDISGKGIAAALLMAHLQASLRSQCAIASDQPEGFLRSVNELFCDNSPDGAYATLFFAEYDDNSRRLRYASCGHPPSLLLRRDGSIDRLTSTGTALGLFRDWECSLAEQALAPGDTLAIYSDGVTEVFSDTGEEFGEERLGEALRRHRELPARAAMTAILDEVRQFGPQEQRDDITLIVATCRPE
jgi:serine phosphatase RsbU (regulator of sigma subunit)/predicted enzyme related to lactoylglutathione lyase